MTENDLESVPHDRASRCVSAPDGSSGGHDRASGARASTDTDTLSEVLRAVRLSGAVFFAIEASEPWAVETPPAREIAPHLVPGVEHVIEYHLVTEGSCWGSIVDGDTVRLAAGDVVVFPQGDAHVMSSAPGLRERPESSPLRGITGSLPGFIRAKLEGGGAERARLICGYLGCDARPFNPLLSALPRILHLPRPAADDGVLQQLVTLALAESSVRRAGGECVLARLSELMFVEFIRRYVSTLPPERIGWLAGLRDDVVGRALSNLHGSPERPWTLDDLARAIGASRSVLAERFVAYVGVPPMQYLARWRMQLASTLLTSTSLTLAEIADRVGYGSETALSRAYRRWVGVAPAEWRRARRRAA